MRTVLAWRSVSGRPTDLRLGFGGAAVAAAAGLSAVSITDKIQHGAFAATGCVVVLLLLGGYKVAKPWFVARSESCHRAITFAPMVAYLVVLPAYVAAAVSLAPEQRLLGGMFLISMWVFHVGGGVGEPAEFPLDRLAGRLARAAGLRVFTMCCGTLGLVWVIQELPVEPRYEPAVFAATTFTVGLALLGASLRVFARVRKLSTDLRRHAQSMIRSLEELSFAEGGAERRQLQAAARRAWDELDLVFGNKVETGFHLYGTFVLPGETTGSLEAAVSAAITDPRAEAPAYRTAVEQLRTIRAACRMKNDTLA
ncbi:hypothetical protein [Streptomyces sp. NBC_01187]|uniref:hypothetical protein n=1 Tax=Streptomyces sp. NBC_01187 TaxID=2903766 RepID=UPI00386A6DE7|nr:hypothetical protein OG220_32335 [Streptomyces sp. NBC_01187]